MPVPTKSNIYIWNIFAQYQKQQCFIWGRGLVVLFRHSSLHMCQLCGWLWLQHQSVSMVHLRTVKNKQVNKCGGQRGTDRPHAYPSSAVRMTMSVGWVHTQCWCGLVSSVRYLIDEFASVLDRVPNWSHPIKQSITLTLRGLFCFFFPKGQEHQRSLSSVC